MQASARPFSPSRPADRLATATSQGAPLQAATSQAAAAGSSQPAASAAPLPAAPAAAPESGRSCVAAAPAQARSSALAYTAWGDDGCISPIPKVVRFLLPFGPVCKRESKAATPEAGPHTSDGERSRAGVDGKHGAQKMEGAEAGASSAAPDLEALKKRVLQAVDGNNINDLAETLLPHIAMGNGHLAQTLEAIRSTRCSMRDSGHSSGRAARVARLDSFLETLSLRASASAADVSPASSGSAASSSSARLAEARRAWQSKVLQSQDHEVMCAFYAIVGDSEAEAGPSHGPRGDLNYRITGLAKAALVFATANVDVMFHHSNAWDDKRQWRWLGQRMWGTLMVNTPMNWTQLPRQLANDSASTDTRRHTEWVMHGVARALHRMEPYCTGFFLSEHRPSDWVRALLRAHEVNKTGYWPIALDHPQHPRTLYHWSRWMGAREGEEVIPTLAHHLINQSPRSLEAFFDGLIDGGIPPTRLAVHVLSFAEYLRTSLLVALLQSLFRFPTVQAGEDGQEVLVRSTGAAFVPPPKAGTLEGDVMLRDILRAAAYAGARSQDTERFQEIAHETVVCLLNYLGGLDAQMQTTRTGERRWLPDWPRFATMLKERFPTAGTDNWMLMRQLHADAERMIEPIQPVYPRPSSASMLPDEYWWQPWNADMQKEGRETLRVREFHRSCDLHLGNAFPLLAMGDSAFVDERAELHGYRALRALYLTAVHITQHSLSQGNAETRNFAQEVRRRHLAHVERFRAELARHPATEPRLAALNYRLNDLEEVLSAGDLK